MLPEEALETPAVPLGYTKLNSTPAKLTSDLASRDVGHQFVVVVPARRRAALELEGVLQ